MEGKITDHLKFPLIYDPETVTIFDADNKMVANIRGWGWIQKLPNPHQFQDKIGEMMVEAFNDKYNGK
ncbi:MAG: hypothetical protein JWQ09_940 [Segetibacter sp.]|nr:hypothetical protein [Segetibacter sp.]